MHPNELLDIVLKSIHQLTYEGYYDDEYKAYIKLRRSPPKIEGINGGALLHELARLHPKLFTNEWDADFQLILNHLNADEYISFFEGGLALTFKGRIFVRDGGYTKQQKRESSKQQTRLFERVALTVGTVSGGVYGLKELFSSEVARNILLAVFLGSLASASILIIIQRLRK